MPRMNRIGGLVKNKINNGINKKTFDLRTSNFKSMFDGMMQLIPIEDFPEDVKKII